MTRIITEHVGEGGNVSSVVKRGLRGGDRHTIKVREAQDERAGDSSAGSTAAACAAGQTRYTSMRLGYARNGNAVTFAHDESWCAAPGATCVPSPGNKYAITWAREYAYDGARARYMNRELDPGALMGASLVDIGTTWSDYDGDEAYGDFTVASASPWTVTNPNSYEPGVWNRIGGIANYLHNDHLGTLRLTTNTSGGTGASRVYTAFGERLPGSATDRFGYVGTFGYQSNADFQYLHVGARYYDPSPGRFLQRDPIGIRGELNVYAYVSCRPTIALDPSGLDRSEMKPVQKEIEKKREIVDARPQSPKDIQEELDEVNDLIWWTKTALSCVLGYLGGGGGTPSLLGGAAGGVGGAVLQ